MAYHRGQNTTFEFCLYFWHSILQFYNLYLHLQFNIQVSNFSTPIDDLTLFVSQFNIQVYAIQHSTLENACFRYPTAIQSMTVSVGSENYQNSPCVGASKGRSRYPRQQLLPRKNGAVVILFVPNTRSYVSNLFVSSDTPHSYISLSYKVKYHICHWKYKKSLRM